MKRFVYMILSSAACMFAAGCSGTHDDDTGVQDSKLVLIPDKESIIADGKDAVTFSVSDGEEDVTGDASVFCSTLASQIFESGFSTVTAGTYEFYAEYDGRKSAPVSVVAQPEGGEIEDPSSRPDIVSRFERHVCVMEFTGQWCSNCPDGYNSMKFIIDRNFPDIAHVIALHDNTSGKDDLAIDVQVALSEAYGIQNYPYSLVDMREASPLGDIGGSFRKAVNNSIDSYPALCGVAVASDFDETTGTADITVRLFSEYTSEYRIAVYIVEDNIVGTQNVNGRYTDDYVHHHVARQVVSSSWKGDALGEVPAGEETVKKYTVSAGDGWDMDNVSVYALAIDYEGYVNNVAVCGLVDGNTDYPYLPKEE